MDEKSSSGSAVNHDRVPPSDCAKLRDLCDPVDVGHYLLTCHAAYSRDMMEEAKGRYADEGGDVRFHEIRFCPACMRYDHEEYKIYTEIPFCEDDPIFFHEEWCTCQISFKKIRPMLLIWLKVGREWVPRLLQEMCQEKL